MKIIYLDYHATTPQDPRVTEAMLPFFHSFFANSSSAHLAASPVKEALEEARSQHATYLHCEPKEVLFMSSATEANNLVFTSLFKQYGKQKNHVLLSPIEHKSVIKAAESIPGLNLEWLKVNEEGFIDINDLEKKISDQTLVVSIVHGNNEIGTIQDIERIGEICRAKNVLFHSDAVQTFAKYPINVQSAKVDLLTWSAHKFYGPKGMGGLYYNKDRVKLSPLIVGGAHEFGLRAGTVNVAGIVGMKKALELCLEDKAERNRVAKLCQTFSLGLQKLLTAKGIDFQINGPQANVKLYNNLNVTLLNRQRKDFEPKLRRLAYSTGSACASGEGSPSHVLKAIGLSDELAQNSFRFSFGRMTTLQEVEDALEIFKQALG